MLLVWSTDERSRVKWDYFFLCRCSSSGETTCIITWLKIVVFKPCRVLQVSDTVTMYACAFCFTIVLKNVHLLNAGEPQFCLFPMTAWHQRGFAGGNHLRRLTPPLYVVFALFAWAFNRLLYLTIQWSVGVCLGCWQTELFVDFSGTCGKTDSAVCEFTFGGLSMNQWMNDDDWECEPHNKQTIAEPETTKGYIMWLEGNAHTGNQCNVVCPWYSVFASAVYYDTLSRACAATVIHALIKTKRENNWHVAYLLFVPSCGSMWTRVPGAKFRLTRNLSASSWKFRSIL